MMIETMTTTKKPPHSEWLDKQFIAWRAKQTSRQAGITQFAEHIGINRAALNVYMLRGSRPDGENLERIGAVLGYEIYDLLELERPDPQLRRVAKLFDALPPELRDKAEELLRKMAGDPLLGKPEKSEKLKTKGKAAG